MTKKHLAEQIGKTPTAVAQYEKDTRPSPATVAKLALALGQDVGFFMPGPRRDGPVNPHFRSLRAATQSERFQAIAFAKIQADRFAVLEREFDFPEVDIPEFPVDGTDPSPDPSPEEAACYVREAWSLGEGPIRHTIRLCENHGILVVFNKEQPESIDAHSFHTDDRPIIVLSPSRDDYYRLRFDVAHELGHLVMHADAPSGGRIVEQQAHRFASEFLAPSAQVRPELPARANWTRLVQLKEHWGMSMAALLYQARYLGVMSDVTYRNAMIRMGTEGWRRAEPGGRMALERTSLVEASRG
jgi:Zn-dependent peptidase ImmA (M78 family)